MMIPTKTTIGVFFGSRSPEHDVSIITGELVLKGLSDMGYEVVPVYISKEGTWHIGEGPSAQAGLKDIEFFKNDDFHEALKKLPEYTLNLNESQGSLVFEREGFFGKKKRSINLAFPAMHGSYGEDGTLQGLFEMFNIAYVGCGVATSALSMDKALTKLLYQKYDIPTTDFVSFSKSEWHQYKNEVVAQCKKLGTPLFVKPARTGSSIGITKVDDHSELEFAIEVALHYDDKVLVEKGIEDVADVTVCIIGNGTKLTASKTLESVFPEGSFFNYNEKYINEGGAQLGRATKRYKIPADLSEETNKEIIHVAKDIYHMFECAGIARIDFLYDRKTKTLYANEINTMPGTLYHHLWKESGMSLRDLLKNLIEYAKERHKEKGKITHTFDSPILKQTHAGKLSAKLEGEE